MSTKPIGGIKSCVLYAAGAVENQPVTVELMDDRSTYNQMLSSNKGVCTVTHTLRLVAYKDSAVAWLESHFIRRASIQGVVAELTLNDGGSVKVGYSEALLYQQPLRLSKVEIESGSSAEHIPTVVLTLCSQDTSLNI